MATHARPDLLRRERAAARAALAQKSINSPATYDDSIAKQASAMDLLNELASDYRQANPGTTQEIAFAKIYEDAGNRALAMAERRASRAMIGI